jgi:hypothetical protein
MGWAKVLIYVYVMYMLYEMACHYNKKYSNLEYIILLITFSEDMFC